MASANQLMKSIQRKESFLQVSSAIHGEERPSRLIITQPKQEEGDSRDSEESKSSEELVDAPELPVAAPAPARPSGVGVVAPAARRVSNAGAGAALVPGARRTSTAGGKRNSRVSPMPISLAAGGGLEAGKAAAEVAAAEPTNGGGSEAAPLSSASTQGAPEAAGAAAGTAAAGAPEVALASGAAPAAAAAPAATAASGPEPSAKPLSRWGKLRVAAVSATRLRQANEKIRVYGTKKARDESEDDSDVDPEDPRTVQERKAAAEARWYIVLPNSWFKRWWESVVLVTLIYVIVIVPVRVGFDIEVTGGAATFDIVVDFFFLFDVFLNFFAAYATSTGDLVVDHRLIAMHYIQGWFTLDLLASIPFYMFETTTNEDGTVVANSNSQLNRFGRIARIPRIFRLVRLLRLLKLLRAFRFIRIFNQWETHNVSSVVGGCLGWVLGVLRCCCCYCCCCCAAARWWPSCADRCCAAVSFAPLRRSGSTRESHACSRSRSS